MPTGSVRHYFPGGNTPQGFVSYYDYIISPNANRIFILKGGPGTGKSTFMKRIAAEMNAAGFTVEHHHCSSDNNSLDGIVIPKLEIAFIDGTAPHITDPKHPGCIDEIIHLGDYWDESGIVKHKTDILACNAKIKASFQRAYRLLRSARAVYDDWEAVSTAALNTATANAMATDLTAALFSDVQSVGSGKTRKLFASAITPNGSVNYLDSLVGTLPSRYIITGAPGSGKSTIVQKLADTANAKGLDIELFYCPFDPLKPEHLVIPALGIAVASSIEPHTVSTDGAAKIVNMDDCLDPAILTNNQEAIKYDKTMVHELFGKAISAISQAKQLHDELEQYYIPYMDFAGIEILWKKTLDRVLGYAN
jgi:cytidylate kinase